MTDEPGLNPGAYDPAWPAPAWESCPCCSHLGMVHDIDTPDEPRASCCADGCECGPGLVDIAGVEGDSHG